MLVLLDHLNIVSFLNLSSCCIRRYTQHLIVFLILHHFRLPLRLRLPAVSEFIFHTKSRRLGSRLLQSCSIAFTPNPNSAANSCAMQKHPQWSWNLDLEISLSKIPPRLRRCMFICLFACLLAAKVLIVGCSLQHIRSQCCQAKTPDHRYVFTPWKRHMALHQSKRSVTLQGEKRRKTGWAATWKRRALASQSSNSNNSNPSRPIQSSSQSTARVRLCYCTFSQPHSKHLVQKQKMLTQNYFAEPNQPSRFDFYFIQDLLLFRALLTP